MGLVNSIQTHRRIVTRSFFSGCNIRIRDIKATCEEGSWWRRAEKRERKRRFQGRSPLKVRLTCVFVVIIIFIINNNKASNSCVVCMPLN